MKKFLVSKLTGPGQWTPVRIYSSEKSAMRAIKKYHAVDHHQARLQIQEVPSGIREGLDVKQPYVSPKQFSGVYK